MSPTPSSSTPQRAASAASAASGKREKQQETPPPPLPAGLTTSHAIEKLLEALEHESLAFSFSPWDVAVRALSPASVVSLFPLTTAAAGLAQAAALAAAAACAAANGGWFLSEAALLVAATLLNVFLNVREQYLREVELHRRVGHVINRLRQVKDDVRWSSAHYPHPHTPLCSSIVLQWTLRDKRQVNLPWALLVEGDLVMLKPGQVRFRV